MSIEQLIILILFVIIPLVQALRRKVAERRGGRVEHEEPLASEELPSDWPLPFEPSIPVPPVQRQPAYVTPLPPPPASLPSLRASERPEPMTRKPARPPLHPEPRSRIGLVPSDPQGMRRVMVLMAVFGPPRSMDPYGRG